MRFSKKGKFIPLEVGKTSNKIISSLFIQVDKIAESFPILPKKFKEKCVEDSYKWITERINNGLDGLGDFSCNGKFFNCSGNR